jgi:aryl-alcohol dehydrogenase-like predicted oxidoreductase
VDQRTLGQGGPAVSAIGLGCMGMSDLYGPSNELESVATIHAAIDAGVTLLDTGDFYGSGHNEMLVGRALRERGGGDRDKRDPGGGWVGQDCRPAAVKNFLAYTLRRLRVDHIDIYRPARLDPAVPIEDTVGAIAECVQAGWVRHIGLSEVGADTVRRAHATHPITDLQIEYSLISRGIETEILPTCRELGIGITAYGVMSRGLLSDSITADRQLAGNDFRAHSPRFTGDNLDRNLKLVAALRAVAEQAGLSTAQAAIAWVLSRGEDIVPLVGSRTRARLAEALATLDHPLTADERARIEQAVPAGAAAGDRYAPAQMSMLDSERR